MFLIVFLERIRLYNYSRISRFVFKRLQEILEKYHTTTNRFLWGTQLNSRIDNNIIPNVINRHYEETINENGNMLIEFSAHNVLRINSTFFEHKTQHNDTFFNIRGQQSTAKYTIISRTIKPNNLLDVWVPSSANVGIQHNVLVLCKYRS